MDKKTIDVIIDQLQEQQVKMTTKADKLRDELAELTEEIARFDAAQAALSGTVLPASGKSGKKEKRRSTAPAASRMQVVGLISEELVQHKVLQEEELKTRIEQKLVQTGHTRMGYALRFKEALADARFVSGERGITLKTNAPQSALS